MNKENLRTKLRAKGVLPESIPYIFRALTASNQTLIEFDGKKSEVFNGTDGIIKMNVNSDSFDFVGTTDKKKKPTTFVRVTGPRSYFGGYTKDQDKFELIVGIQVGSGAIIATRAIPGLLGISAQTVGYYSHEDVAEYIKNSKHLIEDQFDIIFAVDPTIKVDLKGKIMSYREPFEPTKLIGLLKNDVQATKQINELTEHLINGGIPAGVVAVLPKILEASNRTFVGIDGKRSEAFMGPDGLIHSNIGIKNQNGIGLVGVNSDEKPEVLVQIKQPSHFDLGDIYPDPVQVKIAILSETGEVFVTTAYPRESNLFSPIVSKYSSDAVKEFASKNSDQMTDVFDIVFDDKYLPESVTKLRCQRMSYETPFNLTKLLPLIERGKKIKQMH